MAQQTINVGAAPNDGTGTPLRTAFQYTNSNFSELYTALGGGVGLPGATTQVIFNDGGTNLAGDAGLVYNKTTDALTIGGNVQAASATITGDLTVDTSTLKVDSANNRVGINTASPSTALDVFGGNIRLVGGNIFQILNSANDSNVDISNNGGAGVASMLFKVAGSSAMTLNSTGLGVGASPTQKLHVKGIVNYEAISGTTNVWQVYTFSDNTFRWNYNGSGADELIMDSTGNLGVGVTPSYKLHVNGRVSYSTGIGEGADLTLSSTGTQVQHGISSTWTSQNFYTGGTSRVVMKQNGQVRFVPLAADPAGAEAGDVYYNSTSNKLKCYNGTTWNDLF